MGVQERKILTMKTKKRKNPDVVFVDYPDVMKSGDSVPVTIYMTQNMLIALRRSVHCLNYGFNGLVNNLLEYGMKSCGIVVEEGNDNNENKEII